MLVHLVLFFVEFVFHEKFLFKMPPRRASHLENLPLTLASTAESIEARVKRLRPSDSGNVVAPAPVACVGTPSPGVASSVVGGRALPVPGLRNDAPVVRNLRRGSFLTAAEALASAGAGPLVEDLVRDRTLGLLRPLWLPG